MTAVAKRLIRSLVHVLRCSGGVPAAMRAVMCKGLGGPDDLVVEDVAPPVLAPHEVRIRVDACGVNFPDTLIIAGKYQLKPDLPFSPGGEVAGEIIEVGEQVTGFAKGDPVIAVTFWGGFAQEVTTSADRVLHRPAGLDPVTAAAFPITYGSSCHALRQRAALAPGETLLVLGASGGVGLAAVEIGKVMGARVIAAASSAEKVAIARAHGADETLVYGDGADFKEQVKALTGGRGVDVVYDPVGGDLTEQALRATAWNGRLLVVGFASGTIPRIPLNLALVKGVSIVGVFWGTFREREPEAERENFADLFRWHAQGALNPLISRVYPLDEAAEALKALMGRKVSGKLVLTTR